jgi:phage FluMu protein Com
MKCLTSSYQQLKCPKLREINQLIDMFQLSEQATIQQQLAAH